MTSVNTETPRQKQMYLYSGSSLPFGQAAQILVALWKSSCTFFILLEDGLTRPSPIGASENDKLLGWQEIYLYHMIRSHLFWALYV